MRTSARGIGPISTVARVGAGLGILYLAGSIDGRPWDVSWFDPVVGLVALPGFMVALGLLARRYADGPVRFTGPLGHPANLAVIVVLLVIPYTAGGAALFYGATMLVAAWRGQRGCEITVISNLVLRRDDQIGCTLFLPVDVIEDRLTRSRREQTSAESGG